MTTKEQDYLRMAEAYIKSQKGKKFLSFEALVAGVGVSYTPLSNALIEIEPMVLMDPTINMMNILPGIEEALKRERVLRKKTTKREEEDKALLAPYPTVTSFVYQKMTSVGGLVDKDGKLSDADLKILEKLISRELKARKAEKKKKKAKGKRR